MKRYDSYKDSGVEWIGKIPSHWDLLKGKYSTKVVSGFPFNSDLFTYDEDDSYLPLIRIRDITNLTTEVRYKGKYPEESVVNNGDVLIGMDGDFNISLWKGEKGLLNQRVCRLVETDRLDKKYAYYMLGFPLKCINDVTYSTTVKHLSTYDILDTILPVPPINEQKEIANYLDKKCGEIDKAIATQEKRVELLKELRQNIITQAVTRGINPDAPLKDSGVEWIGEVPEHWDIKRIKHCTQIFGRIGFRGYTTQDLVLEGEGPITLSPSNMQGRMNYDSCTYLSWFKYNESPEIQIHNGDVLFVKTGSTYGKSAYVENLPMEATINPQIVVFKDFKDCNSKFFYYLLTTDIVQSQVDNTVIGSTIPTIGQEKIRNYVIPMPPLSEQEEIVSYIESQTARLDTSIEKAEHQIELLQELKQSIITEVVTGKRKVC